MVFVSEDFSFVEMFLKRYTKKQTKHADVNIFDNQKMPLKNRTHLYGDPYVQCTDNNFSAYILILIH